MNIEIKITGTKKAMNLWTLATATVNGKTYKIQMVKFQDPSIYGIRKGRISKLWAKAEDGNETINYDRGWDQRPVSAEGKALLAAIVKQPIKERKQNEHESRHWNQTGRRIGEGDLPPF